MTFVSLAAARQRIARMQVKWHAELFEFCPEWPVLRQVVVDRGVSRADL